MKTLKVGALALGIVFVGAAVAMDERYSLQALTGNL